MDNEFGALTQPELLALALEATRRGESGRSLLYLKEASSRQDAPAQSHFLLGSEYAQIGLFDDALGHLRRAVSLDPDFAIARFQVGLLQLTNALPEEALASWAPLADLGQEHPLAVFRQGLEHLIRDEFADCVRWLERGIALNTDNAALNADMQRIIDRVKDLPATAANAEAQVKADEEPQSHLFLNAYTGGKVH